MKNENEASMMKIQQKNEKDNDNLIAALKKIPKVKMKMGEEDMVPYSNHDHKKAVDYCLLIVIQKEASLPIES